MILPGGLIGIVGGGQLGRMMALAAANLGYRTHIFTPEKSSPAEFVSHRITIASYEQKTALFDFAANVDVITFEFENIPVRTLDSLAKQVPVHPSPNALYIAQNRIREKQFVQELGFETAPFRKVTSFDDFERASKEIGKPGILKTTELGYDGKGQFLVEPGSSLESIYEEFSTPSGIYEGFVPFVKELSVIIARNAKGQVEAYPLVENIHRQGILRQTTAPANVDSKLHSKAKEMATAIANRLDLVGLLAIECFVTPDSRLIFNEMAPRPHNSGHWTMDGCVTSQFEQHIRAICGLPLGSVEVITPVVMENLIGDECFKVEEILQDPRAKLHLYGKLTARQGRKMGHVNRLKKI